MPIPTYWAVPAGKLQRNRSFKASVSARPEDIVYLDDQARVWREPSSSSPLLFQGTSAEWCGLCSKLTRGMATPSQQALKPHRWNKHFQWQRPRGPFRWLTEAQVDMYDRNGWIVLEDAVAPEVVERLIRETDEVERVGEGALRRQKGRRGFIARADEITFTTHLVRRLPFVREFYCSELFRNICFDLIGPDVRIYWDQAIYKKPGVSKPFPWHQDNGYTFVDPQAYLTIWIGLDHANEDNGCMWMKPGVHKQGTVQHELTDLGYVCFHESPKDAVSVPTRPGTVIVLSSLTPHMTGANATAKTRRALIAQFVPDGAVAITEDAWGNVKQTVANQPDRQFKILAKGEPVE